MSSMADKIVYFVQRHEVLQCDLKSQNKPSAYLLLIPLDRQTGSEIFKEADFQEGFIKRNKGTDF